MKCKTLLSGLVLIGLLSQQLSMNVIAKELSITDDKGIETPKKNSSEVSGIEDRVKLVSGEDQTLKNDFSEFIDKGTIKETTEEEEIKIELFVTLIDHLTFDDVLQVVGGRAEGTVKDRTFDKLQLDESFETIKKNKEDFVTRFIQAFPEVSSEEIEDKVRDILFSASYFYRWYNVKIGNVNLWNVMMFDHHELTKDNINSFQILLGWTEDLKKSSNGKLNSESIKIQETFRNNKVFVNLEDKRYQGLIEWFIRKEGKTTDYTTWFRNYFNGKIYKDIKMASQYDVGTWNKKVLNDLPFLLTLQPNSDFVIGELRKETLYTTQLSYDYDVKTVIGDVSATIDNYLNVLARTKETGQKDVDGIGERYIKDRFTKGSTPHIVDAPSDLAKYYIYGHSFNVLGAFSAVAGNTTIQIGSGGRAGSRTLIAHEFTHEVNGILKADSEYFSTYQNRKGDGAFLNTYLEAGVSEKETVYTNKSFERFKTKKDIIDYASGYESLIYVFDAALAEVILSLPVSEQVKYLRKVSIYRDSGSFHKNNTIVVHLKDLNDLVHKVTEEELKTLNIKTIDDLLDAGMSIYQPNDTSTSGTSYGSSLTRANFYLHQGKSASHNQRMINTLLGHNGWEAFLDYNLKNDVKKPETAAKALQDVYGDPSLNFRLFMKKEYQDNIERAKKEGLKDIKFEELKNAISNNLDGFYNLKKKMAIDYLGYTDEFREDIFGEDEKITISVTTHKEFVETMLSNPLATIRIKDDLLVSNNEKDTIVPIFKGKIYGDGHTITGLRRPLIDHLENATIQNLVLSDVDISETGKADTGIGAVSNTMNNVNMGDVHVQGAIYGVGDADVGGISGRVKSSSIIDSSVDVKLGGRDTGGIAGAIYEKTLLKNVYTLGEITDGRRRVGGIVGNGFNKSEIINAYNQIIIKSKKGTESHGIFGSGYSGGNKLLNISNTLATGDNLHPQGYKFAGKYYEGTNRNNYELESAIGKSSQGIKELDVSSVSLETVKDKNFYTEMLGWDTEKVWNISKINEGKISLRNSDPRNEEEGSLEAPIVYSITNQDDYLTGEGVSGGRVTAKVEGKEIGSGTVTDKGEFKLKIGKQKVGTIITVFQTLEGIKSLESSVSVEKQELTLNHQYKLGYWNAKKRFVLEGQAGIEGMNFETTNEVEKFVEVVDEEGKIISKTKAVNTNWYDKKSYDGYQVELGEKELKLLPEGNYTLQVRLVFEEEEYTVSVSESVVKLRGINDHATTISAINSYTLGSNFIEFNSMNSYLIMTVKTHKNGLNKLYEYNGTHNERVYDGWLNHSYDFENAHKKIVVIEDEEENPVKIIDNIATWNINTQFNQNVEKRLEKSGFQAVIPNEYRDESYRKYIVFIDDLTQNEIGKFQLLNK